MSYKLFLDDERDPYKVTWVDLPLGPWVIARDYATFVDYITKNGIPSFVSFDHDLADEHYRQSMYDKDKHYPNYYTDGTLKEKTGYDCAKWLINYCQDIGYAFPEYSVHSMNPVGKENIIKCIDNYRKNAIIRQ
jgi:hypothetical protein